MLTGFVLLSIGPPIRMTFNYLEYLGCRSIFLKTLFLSYFNITRFFIFFICIRWFGRALNTISIAMLIFITTFNIHDLYINLLLRYIANMDWFIRNSRWFRFCLLTLFLIFFRYSVLITIWTLIIDFIINFLIIIRLSLFLFFLTKIFDEYY